MVVIKTQTNRSERPTRATVSLISNLLIFYLSKYLITYKNTKNESILDLFNCRASFPLISWVKRNLNVETLIKSLNFFKLSNYILTWYFDWIYFLGQNIDFFSILSHLIQFCAHQAFYPIKRPIFKLGSIGLLSFFQLLRFYYDLFLLLLPSIWCWSNLISKESVEIFP